MKVPNIVIYETIQKHINRLCNFYEIKRNKIKVCLSRDAVEACASLPHYLVPDIAELMLKEGKTEGIKKALKVGEVTIVVSIEETKDIDVQVIHSAGYLLIKEILDKVIHPIPVKEYKVLLSTKGAALLDTMELWEAKGYTNPDKTPIIGGLPYLAAVSMQSLYSCPDRTLFKLEIVNSQDFLYKIEEEEEVIEPLCAEKAALLLSRLKEISEDSKKIDSLI